MEEKVGEKLNKILEKLEESKSEKKFKLPLNIRLQKRKIRKNFAVVQIIQTNGGVQFKMMPIVDNTIKLGEVYYEASADYMLRYKNYPFLILPEWNLKPIKTEGDEEESKIKPFSSKENLQEAIKNGSLSSAEKFILNRIKMDTIKPKFQGNIGLILIILLGIGGFLWALSYLKFI